MLHFFPFLIMGMPSIVPLQFYATHLLLSCFLVASVAIENDIFATLCILPITLVLFFYSLASAIDCNAFDDCGYLLCCCCIDYHLQSMQNLPDHCAKFYIFWQ